MDRTTNLSKCYENIVGRDIIHDILHYYLMHHASVLLYKLSKNYFAFNAIISAIRSKAIPVKS